MSKMQELIKAYAEKRTQENYRMIVSEVQTAKVLWSAYSPVTKGHFIDYVQGVACAFVFSEKKYCEDFCRHMLKSKMTVGVAECKKESRLAMLTDYHRSGIEGILVDNGQPHILVEMKDVINAPDFSDLPVKDRPILNPSLVSSANRFFQCMENKTVTPDMELNLLTDVYRAKYLVPAENKPKDGQITVPALERNDGAKIVPFFTDIDELRKFEQSKQFQIVVGGFEQLETFCKAGETVVINPFGFNFALTGKTCEAVHNAVKIVPQNDAERAVIFTPEGVPEELLERICALFEEYDEITAGYVRGLRKNGTSELMIVVRCGEDAEKAKTITDELSAKAKEFTKTVPIFTSTAYQMGNLAANGAIPFFERIFVDSSIPPENF